MSPRHAFGPAPRERDAVITGLGLTTALGGDVASTWQALLDGACGVECVDFGEPDGPAQTYLAARAAVDPRTVLPSAKAAHCDRSAQFALVAAREAVRDAGFADPSSLAADGSRVAVIVGVGLGGLTSILEQNHRLQTRGAGRVSPRTIPVMLPNHPAAEVGLMVGAKAGVHAPVSACASGAEAVVQALGMIRDGRADLVVAGGTEAALHPLALAGFARLQALSLRLDDPKGASRPFDADRDGFVMGEGAGMLVVESAAHAAARGARVHGRLTGAGITNDSHHVAQPAPGGTGCAAAVDAALSDAGLLPEQVRHVNAHATSTPLGDLGEAQALHRVFAEALADVTVSATKAALGHTLGAAGAIEAVLTVLAVRERTAPPACSLERVDPDIALNVVGRTPAPLPSGALAAVSTSMGFGGHNVALAFAGAS
ncbi:3-oxoacyl-[acyl-carrier-protein] synthase 2 [Streptomyces ambofaciens ATCC 23877]|uniref:3-oxoacyl-[acyl-carrier-protein] synthase 2 n=1 Tax=Streptomyces ambofaciens (strain ATCC 23877 / 3486 / DSM 40053 / JCM 4204 / NBRC 12836 / NRRL B-2516) TaxID=278992 RepID=A0ACW3_STRA7|nr:beta-ketoacyl-[acyl-carrier-protein] synthase family protein [Streptomyces ambofaciens]AKZ60022.1 3-oxoacyl-[acyl-carrier-protein] synthase 2 [Streptomyces ambofaciens ATCC 23877]CAJ88318.1 putative 3-oxoacyl-acyl-carrier-protein synthase [Streptomyces ambofaciens ATCC 23877]